MCAQWGEAGYNFSRPSAELKRILPLEAYQKMVDDVAGLSPKPWFYIWGGEPFLYPHLIPLVQYMKKKRFTVSIVTNGTKIEEHAKELVDAGLDVILVSIDGPKETHDNVRGLKGAFESSTNGIRAIQAEKARQGKAKPYVSLMSVITRENMNNLEELYEVGESLDIDMMLTWYGWYQTWERGSRHTEILQKNLGITPMTWRGYLWDAQSIDSTAVARSVKTLKQRKWKFPYVFFPELKEEEVPAYYSDHSNTFGFNHCRAPWVMTEIMPNGDVATCRDYSDVVVGNIQNDSILDIWNNQRYKAFRTLLKSEGLLPVCSRCQGLMGL
jgi:radical SAM protein with 4Fe4S-binding SPASM domain